MSTLTVSAGLVDWLDGWLAGRGLAVPRDVTIVTAGSRRELVDRAVDAEWRAVSDGSPMRQRGQLAAATWAESRHTAGMTTITPHGVLVVLDTSRIRCHRDLVATLAHELVHATQLTRPGRRDAKVAGIRHNAGISLLTRGEVRVLNRTIRSEEREAARIERQAVAEVATR